MIEILLLILPIVEGTEEVLTCSGLFVRQREVIVFFHFGSNGHPNELGLGLVELLSVSEVRFQRLLICV